MVKKTAQKIIKNFNGKLPDNFEDLISLPGIGNYTASAILSIAFDKPYIPLDGNIERVIKRLLNLKSETEIRKENLIKKKKILYRLKYRGIKELDLLFERFSEKYFKNLSEKELIELDELLTVPDQELLDMIMKKKKLPKKLKNKTFERLISKN